MRKNEVDKTKMAAILVKSSQVKSSQVKSSQVKSTCSMLSSLDSI